MEQLAGVGLVVLVLWLGATSARANEDYYRIAPKPVPAQPATPVTPPIAAVAAPADPNQVLIRHLKALVFVPTPSAVSKGLVKAQGIELKNVTPPSPASFESVVSPYLGQTITHGRLNSLVKDIILFYRGHDRPVVDVIVPEQDITTGVVQLVVLEGRVGKVTVAGNRWFSSSEISDGVYVQPGDTINSQHASGRSRLAQPESVPHHRRDLSSRAKRWAQTDLVLQTHDRFPVRVLRRLRGQRQRRDRLGPLRGGLQLGRCFISAWASSSITSTPPAATARACAPMPAATSSRCRGSNTLTFFGSYVGHQGTSCRRFIGINGRSYQISGRYSVPLPTFDMLQPA